MKRNDVVLHPVDRLGAIRAQIANLREQEADVVKEVTALLERADPENQVVDGQLFAARLVTQIRETLIADKVREYLNPQQLFHATKVTTVIFPKLTPRSDAKKEA